MANLYDKAGLVNIPVGYQDGFLYNIKPEDNTLGFRFNRDSAATRVNKEGLIEQVGYFGPELVKNGDFSEIGSELVVNGDFATDSDWTKQNGSTISGGVGNVIANGDLGSTGANWSLYQDVGMIIGKTYKISFSARQTGGTGNFQVAQAYLKGFDKNITSSFENYSFNITPLDYAHNTGRISIGGSVVGDTFEVDNVSVKQVDPNNYWTLGTGWSIGDGKAVFDGTNNSIFQDIGLQSGKTYKVTFTSTVNQGGIAPVLGGSVQLSSATTSGTHTFYGVSGVNTKLYLQPTSHQGQSFNGSITDISVIEVKGDKPRIDYTDSLTSPSLLLEPQSTNLLPYSEDFSQWGINQATQTLNYGISPDGTQNSTRIVFVSSNLQLTELVTSGASTTGSIYIKGVSGETIKFGVAGSESVFTLNGNWQRIEKSGTSTSNIITINTYSGATARDMEIWGAQLEELPYATSYIPTAGSAVTRAQETCVGAGNASTFNSSEGTLYAEIAALASDGTNRYITISDGTNNNRLILRFSNANKLKVNLIVGNSNQFLSETNMNSKQFYKVAFSYKQNQFKFYIDGVLIGSSTSGNVPSAGVFNLLSFQNATGGTETLYGKVKGVYVFNQALTDDELQQLTGPEYNSFAALAAAYNYTVI